MGLFHKLIAAAVSLLSVSVVQGQLPLQNSSAVGSPQCEPLTLPICVQRGLGYDQTLFPNMAGLARQSDAATALESFGALIQFGCDKMADFVCLLFGSPCVEVGGAAVSIPPCRHVCEDAKRQCLPLLQAAGVPWPEQFQCDRFPMMTEGSVRCAEPELRVLDTINEITAPPPPAPTPDPNACVPVDIALCQAHGFTHTKFPNVFGHTGPNDAVADISALTSLIGSQCSNDIIPFVCGAYMPKCNPVTNEAIKPCKETCRRISKECKDTIKELSLGRLDLFSCRNYASKKEPGACVLDIRAPAKPIIMNVTRPAASQARMYFQQPAIPEVRVGGLEITFFTAMGDDQGTITTAVDAEGVADIDVMTGSQYTLMVRAFNDWGKSDYVDAIVPEYLYDHCERITMPMCQDFKYSYTQFPNILQHQRQEDAGLELNQFFPLVNVGCSADLAPFLCSMYAPPCTGTSSQVITPCRELCQSARSGCEPLMNKFGYDWPETMDCSMLPSVEEEGSIKCFNNVGLIMRPDESRLAVEEGDSITPYCTSTTRDSRPQWLDPSGQIVPLKPEGLTAEVPNVFTKEIGGQTISLSITALSANSSGSYTCELGNEQRSMVISMPTTCEMLTSDGCLRVLPYNVSLYPNLLGHTTSLEAEISSYQFLPLLAVGCSPINLPLFVCSLFHPPCQDAIVPPCAELCNAAMTDCAPYLLGAGLTWPQGAQCSRFPSASSGACVPPVGLPTITPSEGPDSTAMPDPTDRPGETTTLPMESVTATFMPGNATNTTGELLRRSYAIRDRGMVQMFRGWVDVQGQGAPNDFCRIVRTDGKPFISCLLAGSEVDDLMAYTSPDPSVEWFDPGYSHTWYMRDEDGDGRDDYCRCIGSVPSTVVVCMKAGRDGFEGPSYDFVPANAPQDCLFYQADPFFGYE
ncbi:uncharacterized protein [Diadema setosum]|uniref:uncharacterized protein n=1 Tax=Diadema setosum TaxID=31175 RepID=UPI003B3A0DCF